jgi:hypothetical protein
LLSPFFGVPNGRRTRVADMKVSSGAFLIDLYGVTFNKEEVDIKSFLNEWRILLIYTNSYSLRRRIVTILPHLCFFETEYGLIF